MTISGPIGGEMTRGIVANTRREEALQGSEAEASLPQQAAAVALACTARMAALTAAGREREIDRDETVARLRAAHASLNRLYWSPKKAEASRPCQTPSSGSDG